MDGHIADEFWEDSKDLMQATERSLQPYFNYTSPILEEQTNEEQGTPGAQETVGSNYDDCSIASER